MKKRKIQIAIRLCLASVLCLILLLAIFNKQTEAPPVNGTESSIDSEPEQETKTESDIESESESETESFTETDSESGTEKEPESEVNEDLSYLEQCELDYVEPPEKRTYEETLQKIKDLSQWFPALHFVYDNADKYTFDLLGALAGNPEMTDFAYGMLYREPIATGGFSEKEIPEEYPLLLQWDIRWGYVPYGSSGNNVGIAGCGPTCLSMASFYLTGNREWTPDAVAKYSEENGHYFAGAGTAWALLDEFPAEVGLTSARVSKTEKKLKSELDKGNVLICSVRLGNFTAGGHFIVIYGYDENGFKVNDPKCVYRSRLTWTYDQIKNDIKQTWSIGRPATEAATDAN